MLTLSYTHHCPRAKYLFVKGEIIERNNRPVCEYKSADHFPSRYDFARDVVVRIASLRKVREKFHGSTLIHACRLSVTH